MTSVKYLMPPKTFKYVCVYALKQRFPNCTVSLFQKQHGPYKCIIVAIICIGGQRSEAPPAKMFRNPCPKELLNFRGKPILETTLDIGDSFLNQYQKTKNSNLNTYLY